MRRQLPHRILSSIIMMLFSISTWALSGSPPAPGTPPPPPGLPIDFGAPGLIAAGLALGIYFIRIRKNA